MEFRFHYSPAGEIRVIQETLNDHGTITSEEYDFWLPEGISKQSSEVDIQKAVLEEFEVSSGYAIHGQLTTFTQGSTIDIEEFVGKFRDDLATIEATITRYGVGGYYELPNKIVINLRSEWDSIESSLMHEMVHLCVEEKYALGLNLNHAETEGLVDYLMLNDPILKKLVPDYHKQTNTISPSAKLLTLLP